MKQKQDKVDHKKESREKGWTGRAGGLETTMGKRWDNPYQSRLPTTKKSKQRGVTEITQKSKEGPQKKNESFTLLFSIWSLCWSVLLS